MFALIRPAVVSTLFFTLLLGVGYPLLVTGIQRRGLDPKPFVIALASAANAGSAATLIGNPQNILIGQVGGLEF